MKIFRIDLKIGFETGIFNIEIETADSILDL